MADQDTLPRSAYDQITRDPPGYRDKRGEWRPENPVSYAPLFIWPVKIRQFLYWLKGYLFSWNLAWFSLTLVTWLYFQPPLEACQTFQAGWIAQMFVRNMALLWIIYGGWHLYLYTFRHRGHRGKYSPRWQNKAGSTYLFKNQIWDNIFWSCVSGCTIWTAYEVVTMWMYANGRLPYIDFQTQPVAFVGVLLLIPLWREFHFYWIHRLIHWKPLYDRIHYLHHYNINPGPWSGLAMHPIEHVLYFSVTLIHWIVPSHPIHFLFNAQHTALTPADSHTGFEGDLVGETSFGSYFHYLHHRHFDCNYGESSIPLDQWFGSFNDGARTDSEISEARRTFHRYVVERVVQETPLVKSFYLRREDGTPLEPYAPGQHLVLKIPVGPGRSVLRNYTLSDVVGTGSYRISVKHEASPADSPELPPGAASTVLHQGIQPGDTLEARGPLGDFTPDLRSRRPLVLVAAGIGITPILAQLKGSLRWKSGREVHLFLGFRTRALELFRDEIDAVCRRHPQVQCVRFYSEESPEALAGDPAAFVGRIPLEAVASACSHRRADYFICGPEEMLRSFTEGLRGDGVDPAHIHTEAFHQAMNADAGGVSCVQHAVTFARSGKTLLWDTEFKNLLEFAESNGISMEAGCMFGECGACSVRVQDGDVKYNYATAIRPDEGHCLPCSCRPHSAITLDA